MVHREDAAPVSAKSWLITRGWVLGFWLLSHAALLWMPVLAAELPAAAFLYTFLPGFLLLRLVRCEEGGPRFLEGLVLSAALSYTLSSLLVLAAHLVPGPLTLAGVLAPLDGLIAVLLLLNWRRDRSVGSPRRAAGGVHAGEVWPVLVVIVLILSFRFVSLGYSEYQGDEIDVTGLVRAAINGQDDAFFLHRKGPVELTVAAAFALFSRNYHEFALRFPFALASGWAVLGTYALARRFWGVGPALAAAALLAVNGIFLGFSRMVQYQGVVSLMLVSAVICFYMFTAAADRRRAVYLAVLGIALWGFGLLTHYEAALIGFVLLLLCLRGTWTWRSVKPIALAAGATAAALAAYYVPFVTHSRFSDTFRRYTEIRISLDRAPFNNLPDYLTSSLFYNSVYYELLMAAGFLSAAWFVLQGMAGPPGVREHPPGRASAPAWPAVLWFLLAVGLVGGAAMPHWLQVGGLQVPVVLVLPAFLALIFGRRTPREMRLLFAWFGSYLVAYAFLFRTPGLHYYTLLPAWCMTCAWGLARLVRCCGPVPYRWAVAGPLAVVLGALVLYHPYMLFLDASAEYALRYPERRAALYWNTLGGPPERFFGLPHRSGWKTVGYLFSQGALRGNYRSNEKQEITTWYTGFAPAEEARPTYYLIADNPTQKAHKQDHPRELLASAYTEIGSVSVAGEPRLHLYRLAPVELHVGDYDDEVVAPSYHLVTGLRQAEGGGP